MNEINIFIYRPDKGLTSKTAKVLPDLCYTPAGQNYRDWKRDNDEAYQFKADLVKRKLIKSTPNSHFVEVAW